ncbi:hypothetical protein Taro_032087 [Colocasia esculenta]|uniref:Uncharacterized protein n=1 Tax=Colocasia esculenta TaxID=4460 RepID=A0A843W533_COLES|nr:hypothetical protein [Colocasia esculenta]
MSTQHPHVSTPLTLLCSDCLLDTWDVLTPLNLCRHNPFDLLYSEEDEECSELMECAVRANVFWIVDFLDSLKLFFAIKYL